MTPAESAMAAAARDNRPRFCNAAKIAVALAATALPFARSHSEEAERWLRILRVHGVVGNAMQSLGLPEDALVRGTNAAAGEPCQPGALEAVIGAARSHARERGDHAITTEDLLTGVLANYGTAFEHALAVRGTSAAELLEQVAARA